MYSWDCCVHITTCLRLWMLDTYNHMPSIMDVTVGAEDDVNTGCRRQLRILNASRNAQQMTAIIGTFCKAWNVPCASVPFIFRVSGLSISIKVPRQAIICHSTKAKKSSTVKISNSLAESFAKGAQS